MLQNLLRTPEETAEPYPKDANAIQYVYVYLCMYEYMCIYDHTYIFILIYTYIFIQINPSGIPVETAELYPIHIYTCILIHMYMYMYMYIHIYEYIHIYTCIYTYIYIDMLLSFISDTEILN
jgi:hypothetical protein